MKTGKPEEYEIQALKPSWWWKKRMLIKTEKNR